MKKELTWMDKLKLKVDDSIKNTNKKIAEKGIDQSLMAVEKILPINYDEGELSTGEVVGMAAGGLATGFATTGEPISAAAIGTIITLKGVFDAEKKKEELKRKWEQQVTDYKNNLKSMKSKVTGQTKGLKSQKVDVTLDIAAQTTKSLQNLTKLSQAQALGVTDESTKALMKETRETAETDIEDVNEVFDAKVRKLQTLQQAIEVEINAPRDYDGERKIRTSNYDEITRISNELAEGDFYE